MKRTNPQPDAFARRLTDYETWVKDSRAALGAFARAAHCRLQDANNVLSVMVRCSADGLCDLTTEQLADKTLLSEAQVKRCLRALHDAGAVVTVLPGRSAGCNGGRGRGAVRRLTMIGPNPIPAAATEPAQPEQEHPYTFDRIGNGQWVMRMTAAQDGSAQRRPWRPGDTPAPPEVYSYGAGKTVRLQYEYVMTQAHPDSKDGSGWKLVPCELEPALPEPAPAARMTVHSEPNDGAPECTPLRSFPYGNHLRAESENNAQPVQTPVPIADTACQRGGEDENNEPTSAPVAPVVSMKRYRTRPPVPDRRAFPTLTDWCTAMAEYAAATEQHQPEQEPQQSEQGYLRPSHQHPMPSTQQLQQLAAAAGRRYAQAEFVAGRCDSLPGLTRWATERHAESLRALCATNDNWRRWVAHASAETVAVALHHWHQDRMVHQSLVEQLDAETQQQLQRSNAG